MIALGIRTGRLDSNHPVGAIGALASLLAVQTAQAQWVGPSFTHEQATNGRAAYETGCASCHGDSPDGGELGPPLRGRLFLQQWGGKSVAGLFAEIVATKPSAAPGTLGDSVYADLMAYILQGKRGASQCRGVADGSADAQYPSGAQLRTYRQRGSSRWGLPAAPARSGSNPPGRHHAGDRRDADGSATGGLADVAAHE